MQATEDNTGQDSQARVSEVSTVGEDDKHGVVARLSVKVAGSSVVSGGMFSSGVEHLARWRRPGPVSQWVESELD